MEKLIDSLRPFIQELKHLCATQEALLRVRVDEVLARKSQNIDEIDHLLDDLLNIAYHGYGREDFKRLHQYLMSIEPKCGAHHWKYYQEILADEATD